MIETKGKSITIEIKFNFSIMISEYKSPSYKLPTQQNKLPENHELIHKLDIESP